jgi:hypothetical protein
MEVGSWYLWGKMPEALTFIKVLGFNKVNDRDMVDCLELVISKRDYEMRKIGYVLEQLRPGLPRLASEAFIHIALMWAFGDDV